MTPQKLTLENFLSYQDPETLDFGTLSLACISGQNGHGKSALLDAMTWALWGEARKPSGSRKPDDNLLNRTARRAGGAAEMQVDFEFTIGEARYRALRTYRETASGKTTSSDLEFWSGDTNLTGKSQRATQAIIDETIGVSYETFVNTSLLLQGQAGQFAEKTPAERKALLAEVLRLGRYETLRSAASDKIREASRSADEADREAKRLAGELEGAADRKAQLSEARQKLAGRKERFEAVEARESSLQETVQDLQVKAERLSGVKDRLRENTESLNSAKTKLTARKGELEDLPDVRQLQDELDSAKENQTRLQSEIEEMAAAKDRHDRLAEERETRRNALRERRAARKERESSLEGELRGLDIEGPSPEELAEQKEKMQARHEEIKDAEKKSARAHETALETSQKINALTEKSARVETRLETAQNQLESFEGLEGTCPRCGSEITEAHVRKEREKLNEKTDALTDKLAAVSAELETTREENREAGRAYDKWNELGQEAGSLRAELGSIDQRIDRAHAKRERKENLERELEAIQSGEADERYGIKEAKKELAAVNESIEALGFDASTWKELKEKRAQAKRATERKSQAIEETKQKRASLQATLQELKSLKQDLSERVADLEKEAEALSEATASLQDKKETLDSVRQTRRNLSSEISDLKARVGTLSTKVERDENAREKKAAAERRRAAQREEEKLYEHLKSAFSKHGIPSLIIESALPDIEARANRLLDELSGGALSLRLETTREKKTGGTADTLEIQVIDASGAARSFETFSGGEGFRISLALRVALSEVLAGRSGAPLETLVIDEGFGTQDASGLEAVQQAIGHVASQFNLVLVITHLDALKDAFPQRINVEKTPGRGSALTVQA